MTSNSIHMVACTSTRWLGHVARAFGCVPNSRLDCVKKKVDSMSSLNLLLYDLSIYLSVSSCTRFVCSILPGCFLVRVSVSPKTESKVPWNSQSHFLCRLCICVNISVSYLFRSASKVHWNMLSRTRIVVPITFLGVTNLPATWMRNCALRSGGSCQPVGKTNVLWAGQRLIKN